MIHWSTEPPPEHRGQAIPIRRTPATGGLHAVVASHDLIGCATHFWGGRTYPCLGQDCPACTNASPWRWHAYMIAKSISTSLVFLFETTAGGAEAFVSYRHIHGTLRGCEFQASRLDKRANGQVIISTRPSTIDPRFLHAVGDLRLILSKLWNIPADAQQLIAQLKRQTTPEPTNGPTHIADSLPLCTP